MSLEIEPRPFFPEAMPTEDREALERLAREVARLCGYDPERVTLQVFCDSMAEVQLCLRKARVA